MKERIFGKKPIVRALFFLFVILGAAIFAHATETRRPAVKTSQSGHLYLVSTGIGDLDNMTLRAHRILTEADVYFTMSPERAKETYKELIGDKPVYKAGHGLFTTGMRRGPEKELSAMEKQARNVIRGAVTKGKTVAVLCSGDPTIFCPHTGFMKEFKDLDPQMIPGISSFNAASAALGRSITSGSKSHSVILTAGMGTREGYKGADTLEKLSESRSTMVFFMMRNNLPEAIQKLKTSYTGDTPIAIVSHAGYADTETIVMATLDTILERLDSENPPFEHLVYVGDFLK